MDVEALRLAVQRGADEMVSEVIRLRAEVVALRADNANLRKENQALKGELISLHQEITFEADFDLE